MPTGQQNETGFKSFIAGEALEPFRCVKPHTTLGQIVYDDAGEVSIGVTQDRAASGDPVCVKLWNAPGTFTVSVASGVAAINTALYSANDGQLDDASSGTVKAYNLEVVSAANAQVEVVAHR